MMIQYQDTRIARIQTVTALKAIIIFKQTFQLKVEFHFLQLVKQVMDSLSKQMSKKIEINKVK